MKLFCLLFSLIFAGCSGAQSVVEEMSDAIYYRQPDKVIALVKKNPEALNSKEAIEYCILAQAIEELPEVVETMLDAGVKLQDAKSFGGSTMLATAAEYGRFQVAQLLLDRGANPNELGDNRRSPLATIYRQLQYCEDDEREALLDTKKVLVAGGAVFPSASSLKTCPNGTALIDIDVIESYVELDEEQQKLVAEGKLLPTDSDVNTAQHPYSTSSGWHFNPDDHRWDRIDDNHQSFKRAFPDLLAKFNPPETAGIAKQEYKQVLQDGKPVCHELTLTTNKIRGDKLQSLVRSYFSEQGYKLKGDFLGAVDASVKIDNDWQATVAIHGDSESTNCTLWFSVEPRE